MKLTGIGATSAANRSRRGDKAEGKGGLGFAGHLQAAAEGVDDARPVEATAPLNAVDALLAVQAVPDATDGEARRRLHRRGEDILDRLEELRRAIVLGVVSKEGLIDLARMVRSRRDQCADPNLGAVLDEIELRAEVEIAKLSRRP